MADSDDEAPVTSSRKPTFLEIVTIEDIVGVISKEESFGDLDEEDRAPFLREIAKHLHLYVIFVLNITISTVV